MSTEVDRKVVSMRFDNSQFETNVKKSMTSIENLKRSLNFEGATKSINDVNTAVKKVDVSSMGQDVEQVSVKFNGLQVMAVTALSNITNSAMATGKKLLSAFTIDPIKTGFQEYETQINAVQTILANTSTKGTTIDQVNVALDELNKYADKTIYNFTEMTRNIGTFTAAGIDLDTSVSAIQGIANVAAVSGSTSQQASTAMYQLSQALATGTVRLMDWNSVVNAGMGGQVFQDALTQTSELLGTGAEAAIAANGSFRESLQAGWLTSEVLTETLKKFTTSGANEYIAEYTGLSQEAVKAALKDAEAKYGEADAIEKASEALAKKSGRNADEIKSVFQMAKNAEDAATKVKTFTQLIDTMKEAVQSGWTQSWEILIGNFDEAKTLFTEISEAFGSVIQKSSDARNALLENTFSSKWEKFINQVQEAGVSSEDFTDKLKETAKKQGVAIDELILKHGSLNAVIDKGLIPTEIFTESLETFTEKGTESAKTLQKAEDILVNTGDNLTAIAAKYGMTWKEMYELNKDIISDPNLIFPDQILKLSEAEIANIGYTKKEVNVLKELAAESKKTGTPMKELVESMGKPTGRELLIDSFRNALTGLGKVIGGIHDAWVNAFPPMQAEQLYAIIEAIHKFSENLNFSEKDITNFTRTLKGLFAILDIITTFTGGAVKIAFKVFAKMLGLVDGDILSVTAELGDMLVAFRDWLFKNNAVAKSVDKLSGYLTKGVDVIVNLIDKLKQLPEVQSLLKDFKDSLMEFKNVGKYAIDGLANGIEDGFKRIPAILAELGSKMIESICKVLDINSPSKKFYDVGKYVIEGLLNGIKYGLKTISDVGHELGSRLLEGVQSIDWGTVFSVGITISLLAIIKKLVDAFESVVSPLKAFSKVMNATADVIKGSSKKIQKILDRVAGVVKSFSKVMNAFAFKMKAKAIGTLFLEMAISIAILAGAIAILAAIPQDRLEGAVLIVGTLVVVMGALIFAITKVNELNFIVGRTPLNFAAIAAVLIGLSASLLLMAHTVKTLGQLNPDEAKDGFVGLAACIMSLITVLAAYGKLVNSGDAHDIQGFGKTMKNIGVAMLIMVGVMKIVGNMKPEEVEKGGTAIAGFVGVFTILAIVSKAGGRTITNLGKTMVQMSIAMLLMIAVIKLIAGISAGEIAKGFGCILGFVGILTLLTLITKLGGRSFDKLGVTLIAMSASLGIMAIALKILGNLSMEEIVRGGIAITGLIAVLALMMVMMKIIQRDVPKMAGTLIAMSVAIGILAGVCIMLSLIPADKLDNGIKAVAKLAVIMSLMIAATGLSKACKANLVVMTVAIGVMAASIAALSFIEPDKLEGATKALSTIMGMFALMTASTGLVKGALGTLIGLTLVVAALGAVLYLLSDLKPEQVLGTASALSLLMLSMSVMMGVMAIAGGAATAGLVSLAVMTLVVGGLGFILIKLQDLKPGATLAIAQSLSTLILALSGACILLGVAGLFGPAAIIGVGVLITLITSMAGLFILFGGLVTLCPKLEEFIDKGIPLLEKLAHGIGSVFGNLIGGFMGGASTALVDLGANLSLFMMNAMPFIIGATSIKASMLDGVKNLVAAILLITGADIITGIASFMTGGNSMDKFAAMLEPFGTALADFSEAISGNIDVDAVNAAANAGKMLAEMSKAIPSSGVSIWSMFFGQKDLGAFSENITAFGEAIVSFSAAVSAEGAIDEKAIKNAVAIGKMFTALADSVPPSGSSVVEFWKGQSGLDTFGEKVVQFGRAMVLLSQEVKKGGGVSQDVAEDLASAGGLLTALADNVPESGFSVIEFWKGQSGLDTFGEKVLAFGRSMVTLSQELTTNGGIDSEAIAAVQSAGTLFAVLAECIPDSGGLSSIFKGDNDIEDFGKKITKFGKSMATFSTETASMIDTAGIDTAITSANKILNLARSIASVNLDSFTNFSKAISGFDPASVNTFSQTFSGMGSEMQDVGSNMMAGLNTGLSSGKSDISRTIMPAISSVVSSITGMGSKFSSAGKELMSRLSSGIGANRTKLSKSITSICTGMISSARDEYNDMHNAGKYLVEGFANGIDSNTFKAIAKSKIMAKRAKEAAKKELDEHSPSKEFYKIGAYAGQGFVNAFSDYEKKSYNAGSSIARSASDGLNLAVSRMKASMASDIDCSPTIRPVVDLTEVQAASNSMSKLMNVNSSVGVMADVGIVRGMMSARSQNGDTTNDDVVSAIDNLGNKLAESNGTSYVINGITYDDGSNVANAMREITRAVKIERRA